MEEEEEEEEEAAFSSSCSLEVVSSGCTDWSHSSVGILSSSFDDCKGDETKYIINDLIDLHEYMELSIKAKVNSKASTCLSMSIEPIFCSFS